MRTSRQRYGRQAAMDTSTWGKRATIRHGVTVANGGLGLGEDIGKPLRLLDIRMPTRSPGEQSNTYVVYLSAVPIFPVGYATPAAISAVYLTATLESGAGGITRKESFQVPAHGKALHVAADSLRLSVKYDPDSPTPDAADGMIGFDLNANASQSGLDGGRAQQDTAIFAPPSAFAVTGSQVVRVPEYAERLKLEGSSPASYELLWQDAFGNQLLDAPMWNGSQFVKPAAIPLNAVFLEVQPIQRVASAQAINLSWDRPS